MVHLRELLPWRGPRVEKVNCSAGAPRGVRIVTDCFLDRRPARNDREVNGRSENGRRGWATFTENDGIHNFTLRTARMDRNPLRVTRYFTPRCKAWNEFFMLLALEVALRVC